MGSHGSETAVAEHGLWMVNEKLVLPIPHFAVMTLRGLAYARWMGRKAPIDLQADGMPLLPASRVQPLPLVHFWPVYASLDHPELHDTTGTNAILAAHGLSRRYLLDGHHHPDPDYGRIELEPTQGDVHYVHPRLLASDIGIITAQAEMIVRYDFSETSHRVVRPLPGQAEAADPAH